MEGICLERRESEREGPAQKRGMGLCSDVWRIFGPGSQDSDAKIQKNKEKSTLATTCFTSSLFYSILLFILFSSLQKEETGEVNLVSEK